MDALTVAGLELSRRAVTIGGAIVMILLMGLSGFFSSSEIAMFSLARHRLEALVREGAPGADRVEALRGDPHRLLVTILVGNNVANIGMSSIATGLLALYVPPEQSVLIATFGVTAVVLLFSESAPKSYAVENAESWSLRIARPLQLTQAVLYPLVVVFDRLTRAVNRLTGTQAAIETAYVTRAELRELVEAGEQQGVLEPTEGDIFRRTLRFSRTIAGEVMVPRADVTAVPATTTVDEAIVACLDSGHVRLPVYEGDFETVLGTVHLLDIVGRHEPDDGDGATVADLVRPCATVPETKPIDELLADLQETRLRTAIVVDEFGVIGGMVTVEDIVEELVGEILRPTEERPIEVVDDRTAIVLGDVSIEAVNEALDLELPTRGPFETVAGFVLDRAGELVEPGERVEAEGLRFVPVEVEGGRIVKIRIERGPGE